MTQPRIVQLQPTRGDTYKLDISLSAPLSGISEVWLTIKSTWATTETDDSSAIVQLTLTGGEIVATGAATIRVTFSAEQTSLLVADQYVYDLQIKTTTDEINTAQEGTVRPRRQVTVSTS